MGANAMPTMRMCRWRVGWLPVVLAACCSGCLFVRHTTHQVREKESLRTVQFESADAQGVFQAGVNELKAHKDQSDPEIVAIPFVIWYSSVNELSDNAIYNDQISICDLNSDNYITLDEAQAFRAKVAERLASREKTKGDGPKDGSPPAEVSVADRSAGNTPPPGLIHY
jgi:hypothetical protein